MEPQYDIRSMTPTQISQELPGLPKWRYEQLFWWFRQGVHYDDMSNLPTALRLQLAQSHPIIETRLVTDRISADGTVKYLWQMDGDVFVESVLMKYRHGNTVCISTQAGCRMGCTFCASSHAGFQRNLTAAEMEDQVRLSGELANERVGGVVLMGIGEPLDNFDNVRRFLELVSSPDGLHIGARHISLSTCGGVPDGIARLAKLRLGLTLSISLHAPTDELRNTLMPCNKRCGLESLFLQCRQYFEETGRRISYEYALINGLNDSEEMAEKLVKLLRLAPGHVNLIPLNRTADSTMQPSPRRKLDRFQQRLESSGVNVTVRRRLGSDIDAACGQLRLGSIISGGN